MTTLFDCTLHGETLSALDERIAVTDIRETLQMNVGIRECIAVEVRFCIHEEDPVRRREVMSRIIAWAGKGGQLTTSDRPGLRLAVSCTKLPELSALDWSAEMALCFTSANMPWWESSTPVTVSGNGILSMDVPGDAPQTVAEAIVINAGTAVVTELTIACHMTEMTFRGITLQPGSFFSLMYGDGHLLAWVDGESVLHCRTAQSSDELLAPCGQTATMYATAGETPLQTIFTVRGRFA